MLGVLLHKRRNARSLETTIDEDTLLKLDQLKTIQTLYR
jgi:hypothetical protein